MEKKIIFFDIDGTLMDEKTGTVPQSTITAITKAKQNGHLCIVNTGRPAATIDQVIKDIDFDGYICGCGTYIEFHGQTIFHTELSQKLRQEVIQMIFDCHMDSVLEGKNEVYFLEKNYHPFISAFKQRYLEEGFPVKEFHQGDIVPFDKLTAWYDDRGDIERFKAFLEPNFEVIQRDIDFIEIVPQGYSKATGIQMLIDNLHMTLDQTISIGDSTNDLPMLTYTKESVVMGNGNPILFDLVTYQTTDINDNGIENALKHFQII